MMMLENHASGLCDVLDQEVQETRYLKTDLEEVPSMCTIGGSIYSMYALFVDGIELENEGFNETTVKKGISIAFGILVAVILLNAVIAILNSSWEKVMKESQRVVSEHKLMPCNIIDPLQSYCQVLGTQIGIFYEFLHLSQG